MDYTTLRDALIDRVREAALDTLERVGDVGCDVRLEMLDVLGEQLWVKGLFVPHQKRYTHRFDRRARCRVLLASSAGAVLDCGTFYADTTILSILPVYGEELADTRFATGRIGFGQWGGDGSETARIMLECFGVLQSERASLMGERGLG